MSALEVSVSDTKIQPEEHTVSVLEVSVPMTSKHSRKKATLMLGVWH